MHGSALPHDDDGEEDIPPISKFKDVGLVLARARAVNGMLGAGGGGGVSGSKEAICCCLREGVPSEAAALAPTGNRRGR